MRIYTRRGDDGTTGLFHGGRVPKDATGPEAYGTVDEAVAMLGAARAAAEDAVAGEILAIQRELFVVAAELATAHENQHKLEDGVSRVAGDMIESLEMRIDALEADRSSPGEFIVPGGNTVAAHIDAARTVVRRSERRAVTHYRDAGANGDLVVAYLNRLADYLYMLARAVEGEWTPSRQGDGR